MVTEKSLWPSLPRALALRADAATARYGGSRELTKADAPDCVQPDFWISVLGNEMDHSSRLYKRHFIQNNVPVGHVLWIRKIDDDTYIARAGPVLSQLSGTWVGSLETPLYEYTRPQALVSLLPSRFYTVEALYEKAKPRIETHSGIQPCPPKSKLVQQKG